MPHNLRHKKLACSALALGATALVILATSIVFADETTATQTQINTVYKLIRNFSIPVGAVGMAVCGFMFFFGDDHASEQAAKRIKHLFIASLCIFALGSTVHAAIKLADTRAPWRPGADNSNVIEITPVPMPSQMGEPNVISPTASPSNDDAG